MAENEIVYSDVPLSESQEEVVVEEVVPVIEVVEVEGYDIELLEAFPALEGDDNYNHALLNNREINDAHPITAITGLREELNSIEALQTIYSDKKGNADYYEWADGAAIGSNGVGCFVTLSKDPQKITICTGDDIFGVVVDGAAFVGGQDDVARDAHYGLVATSGAVLVRCELSVAEGDYVTSNAYGVAKKTSSNYGYRVVALHDIDGVPYATIKLNISADQIDSLGVNFQGLDTRMGNAETNIVSAVNVANQAYNKSTETETSNKVMFDKVDNVLSEMDEVTTIVEGMGVQVQQAQVASAQAKAIAESAATSAASMKNEAVESANSAAAQVSELAKTLEPLTTWTDPETGNKGASYLANYIDNGLATKTEIETVEDDLEHAKSAISQNAKSLQSLVVSIDKYSVGEYSTAHGLTLDQATSILEPDIIYVPTIQHKEEYSYVDGEEVSKYEREFVPGYLYRWGELPNGLYGWITVDKYYSEDKLNTSAPSVYFSAEAPSVIDDFGYWYTNSDTVSEGYEPYTLYKWIEGSWVAVATLAGNTQSRAISQVRQTANSIEASVTNMKGDVAASKEWIEDNSTNIQDIVTWKGDNAEAIATTIQKASDSEAYIAQIASVKNEDGTINAAASIVTAVNEDGSGIGISADRITMTGTTTFLQPGDVGEGGGTTIDGARIQTGTISAERLDLSGVLTVSTKKDLVSSVEVLYARSSSSVEFTATTEWSTVAPQWVEGEYVWQKTITTYADHTDTHPHQTVTTTCIQGAKGEAGTSPYLVRIDSTNGNIFRNGEIETVLTATVLHGDKDVTNDIIPGRFLWTRVSTDAQGDVLWNEQKSKNRSKQITITSDDVRNRATFFCTIQDK